MDLWAAFYVVSGNTGDHAEAPMAAHYWFDRPGISGNVRSELGISGNAEGAFENASLLGNG